MIRDQIDQVDSKVFLPDLCGVKALFAVVMISQLLVFILILAKSGLEHGTLPDLAINSLYIQGIALSCAAALCLMRKPMSKFNEFWIATSSYGLVLLVTYGVCELAWWVVNPVDGGGAIIAISRQELLIKTMGISAIFSALVLRYFYVQHHWKLRTALESRARLDALQARIRPHFFFNCMNSIASLTRIDPARAEKAVEDLAELFRASFVEERNLVSLADELTLARQYLDIESLRLGERLQIEWRLAIDETIRIPQLTLQPLLENAIYHGIEPIPEGGRITVEGQLIEGDLVLTISNPIIDTTSPRHSGNQIAQDNVAQRLRAHFGKRGRLLIDSDGEIYRATIKIPVDSSAYRDN